MAKRDADAMDALTDDEKAALDEADAEENTPETEAAEADAAAAEEARKRDRDPETGRFTKAEEKAEGDELSGKDEGSTDGLEPEKKAEEPGPGAEPKAAPEPEAAPTFRKAPTVSVPQDAEAKLADIAKRRDELADKFDNGDITAREMTAELAKLDDERIDLKMAVARAQDREESRKDTWLNDTVPSFLAEHAAYKDNPALHQMLDARVRHMQVAAMEKGEDPLDPAILAEAHKAIVAAVQSLTGAAPAKPEPTKAEAKTTGVAPAKRPSAPPTLAHVPSADPTETDGEFAVLDRLADNDPTKFEDALARMPEHERERYLAAQ